MHWPGMCCRTTPTFLAEKQDPRPLFLGGCHPNDRENPRMAKGALMSRFLMVVVLSSAAFAQLPSSAESKFALDPSDGSPPKLETPSADLPAAPPVPDIPAMPKGKSTVIGGAVREIDGVRDQPTLNIF